MSVPTIHEFAQDHDLFDVYRYRKKRVYPYESDKEKLHVPPSDVQKIGISDLESKRNPRTGETKHSPQSLLYVHKYIQYGDYNSTTKVEKANVEVFLDEYGDVDGVYEGYGAYGWGSVLLRGDLRHDGIIETLEALDSYPLLDEERWSELERESEREYVKESGLDEFRRKVRDKIINNLLHYIEREPTEDEIEAVHVELDEINSELWEEIFWDCFRESEAHFVHEDPNWPYFDIDKVAAEFPYNETIRQALKR